MLAVSQRMKRNCLTNVTAITLWPTLRQVYNPSVPEPPCDRETIHEDIPMTTTLTTIRETRRRLYEDDCRLALLELAFTSGDKLAGALLEDYCAGPRYGADSLGKAARDLDSEGMVLAI